MADLRIKVSKDKAKLVKSLKTGDSINGLFPTYVDVMIFAAALGLKRKKYIPVTEVSRKDPDPIPHEHFVSKGHDQIINLIAITHHKNPIIFANDDEFEKRRIEIFESYANGGLEVIQDVVRGSENHLKQLLLFLMSQKENFNFDKDDLLDISFL